MITIIYSTHKDKDYNENFKQHLLGTVGVKDVQILEYVNHNQYSLSQVYNSGITESIYDIIVCCHNDIKLQKNWGKKLLEDFSNNPEFGIIGKAGSCHFPESGIYWEKMSTTMVGQVYHHPKDRKKWISRYSPKFPFLIPVVTIDGLFISFNKKKIKHKFDETIGKFHFYDHLFCVPNYLEGVKVGVTSSFEITHESIGQPNQEFWESKDRFLEKYGKILPLTINNEIYIPTIKIEKTKTKFKKVAVVIPTKGKVELLYNCIKSYYDFCDSTFFDIFIADTGSNDEEKLWIKNNILTLGDIKFIEYDYYNFAKINNDVVKNHINDDYEFILFSNNDIKILNDVINGMINVFKKDHKTGTVGCRLHFEDTTVQHNGVYIQFNQEKNFIGVGHLGFKSFFNYGLGITRTFGSTGGLLMIRKKIFDKIGGFNENYISCFEDVELNIMTIKHGYNNYINSDCVSFHFESSTRNEDPENLEKLKFDYNNTLLPTIVSNLELLKKFIIFS
jgi:GT2 family glycosyltransferase